MRSNKRKAFLWISGEKFMISFVSIILIGRFSKFRELLPFVSPTFLLYLEFLFT